MQTKRPDGTSYPYPRVKIYVYREDWRLPLNISGPIQPLKILIVQFIKVGDKNGNIIFQVSECAVISPYFIQNNCLCILASLTNI